MNATDSFNSVQTIEFECSPIEPSGEIAVTRIVLFLKFQGIRTLVPIVHIIGVINEIASIDSGLGVLGIPLTRLESSRLLVASILRMGIYAFPFETFLDDFIFDEAF